MAVLHYMGNFVAQSLLWLWLAIFLLGLLVERLAPAEPRQPAGDLLMNLGYSALLNWLLFTAAPATAAAETFILNRVGLGLLPLSAEGWRLVPSAALYVLTADFLEYAFHRAQHAFPLLWSMHSFHHSDRSVNVTTTQRNFWLESPLKLAVVYPVLAVLFRVPTEVLAIYAAFGTLHFFSHLNLRLSLGPFWTVVNGPQFHRIHHSALPQHRDKNFAAFFPVFDILFGTHHRPLPGEFPGTGLDTADAPRGLVEAALWPLRRWLRPAGAISR
ncbi:MAG TPA: sterol desaturase family protein [Stellaceae bacterium]|nr:sterol desaturase family protein [Stellaceae bacterium]